MDDLWGLDDYLGEVIGLRIAVGHLAPPEEFAQADVLIEHGEPAEGVNYIAWTLHEAQVTVPRWVNDAISDLTEGLVAPEHLPPRLPEVED